MAAAHLDHPQFPDVPVIHLVRAPFEVLRSMFYKEACLPPAYRDRKWVEQVLGCQMPGDLKEFCVAFIVQWNERIEHHPRTMVRLKVSEVLQWFGEHEQREFRWPDIRVRTHAARRAPQLTARDLPKNSPWTSKFLDINDRYGY